MKAGIMRTPNDGRGARSMGTIRARALIALGAALGLVIGVSVAAAPAWAEDPSFPTWSDVANARNNEAAQKALVDQINASVANLTAQAEATQKDAEAKGAVYQAADQKFQEQASRTNTLQAQADEANRIADESERQAGLMMAQLYRTGGNTDLTMELFTSANPDKLLGGLGVAGQLTAQVSKIKDKALQDRNTAQAQSDAAEEAKVILEKLKVDAEAAFKVAQDAATAAAAALEAARSAKAEADAKLAVIVANREATEADYMAGIVARYGAGASLAAGEISLSGWALPVGGWISSPQGWRIHPISGGWLYHAGTDIAAGCGTTIYAAAAGVVNYAGPNGGYGNYLQIDHGGGIETGYGHIQWGGILVGIGQSVAPGQPVAYVGTTGNSTGCHLHLEVHQNGEAIDPVPFFANQGITIG
jgi:murein DD-endopeptidase MepM/ murein hydrolase activator NlpD